MSSTQRLRTVVSLGGTVDSSLGNLTRSFEQSVSLMSRETRNLTIQQERLRSRIQQAVLAGRNVSSLTQEYQRLSRRISEAADETARLERLTQRSENASRRLELSGRAGAYAATGIVASGAAITGLMTYTNQKTTEEEGIAKSYDMSLQQYKLWDGIMKQMGDGFDGTKAGDLIEELSNKVGEFGTQGMTKYKDALSSLNLDPFDLDKMTSYDRFMTIMKQLDNVKDKAKGQFAADEIFGGDGNRIYTFLKNSGMSIDEIVKKQEKLNLLTDKGSQGALIFGKAILSVKSVFGSALQEIAGIMGKDISPVLEKTAIDFSNWFSDKKNKAQLVSDVKSFGLTLLDISNGIVNVTKNVNAVAEQFGGWGTSIKLVAGIMAGVFAINAVSALATLLSMTTALAGVAAGFRLINLAFLASPLGAVLSIVSALSGLAYVVYRNWDSLVKYVSDGLDAIAEKWTSFKQIFSRVTNVQIQGGKNADSMASFDNVVSEKINNVATVSSRNNSLSIGEIKIIQQPGEDSQAFASRFFSEAQKYQKLHDPAETF